MAKATGQPAVVQGTFDYGAFPAEVAVELRGAAERIRLRLKRTAEDIVAIGTDLLDAKKRLPHGQFDAWIASEFEMSKPTATNFMQVAERFGERNVNITLLPASVLYLLAAPSTPDAVVEQVTSGKIPATAEAIKAAKEEARQAKQEAEQSKRENDQLRRRMEDNEQKLLTLTNRWNEEVQRVSETLSHDAEQQIRKREQEAAKKQREKLAGKIEQLTQERDRLAEQYRESMEQAPTIVEGSIVDPEETSTAAKEAIRQLHYWGSLFGVYRGRPQFALFESVFRTIDTLA